MSEIQTIMGLSYSTINTYEFVRRNAIEFAKRKMSITYLVVNEKSQIMEIFTLTHKAIQLLDTGLMGIVRKKIQPQIGGGIV